MNIPGKARDNRIDSVRGVLLVVMTIDHLGGWVTRLTNESLGYVSALEGFIFLSGFMFSVAYGGDLDQPRRFLTRVAHRAWTIYRYQLLLLLLLPLLALSVVYRSAEANWVQPYFSAPESYFGLGLLLMHQPVYMDILPLYLLFIALSPAVLFALHRGWVKSVFAATVLVWVAGQEYRPIAHTVFFLCPQCRLGPEFPMAWQLVWVAGLYAGYRYRTNDPIIPDRHRPVLAVAVLVAVVLFLERHLFIDLGFDAAVASDRLHVGWLRMLDFAALGIILVAWLRRVPRERGLPWAALLGRYSIQVFTYHVALVYLLLPFLERIEKPGGVGYVLFMAAALASLTLPAVAYRAYQESGQRRQMPAGVAT
jgi:hypothetical protein